MLQGLKALLTGPHEPAFFVGLAAYALIVLYIFIFGLSDLARFSIKRIWAISGVCFAESIRRRVLWIIPLALVGLVVVLFFQQSWDPQEDIGQTTKFCLFTTGLVMVISTIILSCTSLPREIENRVIFTVVTKPTTRLEIVLGKITGFSRMSGLILIIMGIFTFGYLHLRAWKLQSNARDLLNSAKVEANAKPTLQHYVDDGLLNAKSLAFAQTMNLYEHTPQPGSTRRYLSGEGGVVLVPFKLPADAWLLQDGEGTAHDGSVTVQIRVGYDRTAPTTTPAKPNAPWVPPTVAFQIMDSNRNTSLGPEIKGAVNPIPSPDGTIPVSVTIPTNQFASSTAPKFPYFFVAVQSGGGNGDMWLDIDRNDPAVQLKVPVTSSNDPLTVNPLLGPVFISRDGVSGYQLKGDASGNGQVCVLHFPKLDLTPTAGNKVQMEFRLGVEKSGEAGDEDKPTLGTVSIFNYKTGQESKPIEVAPENNRWFYTSVPKDWVEGSDFDVRVRCLSNGQWLNLRQVSLHVVQEDHYFAWNLIKSTFIMWLLSVLVISISVFCSTFVSWPIAVMLTIVILFAHWGLDQLGDSANAGIGRSVVTEFRVTDPATMQVVSGGVEFLNKVLKQVSAVLPDIDKFAAADYIDHGINIPWTVPLDSLLVLLGFGVPFSAMAYIRFKNMEVAP